MSVTQEEVVAAYRIILGREPENEAVTAAYLDAASVDDLREIFMTSAEFQARKPSGSKIGQYEDVSAIDVQVECTSVELEQMLSRIAREWRKFGETQPHWSVLVQDEYRTDNIQNNIDRFYQSGQNDIAHTLNVIGRAGLDAGHFGKAMDFGCGVGRLTLALASRADHVVGVDISPPHVAIARARAKETGAGNVEFTTIGAVEDLDLFHDFDLIISLIVLQHNPPPVIAVLIEKLLLALAPGGIAILQVPTYLDKTRFSVAEYLSTAQPAMEMNALPQHHVFDIVDRCGCQLLEVRQDGRIGDVPGLSHTFAIRRKPQA